MSTTNAILMIAAGDVTVNVHCAHDDESVTLKLDHGTHEVTVYLNGTLEEIHVLAEAIAKTCAHYAVAEVERAMRGAVV